MNKKDLTEADIRTKFITPAIIASGWDLMSQLREEAYFTKGRVMVRGKTVARGEANKADYLLFYKPNLPIAVIEAKDNSHTVASGMAQALEYAEILDVPFAFSSNGGGFLEHDRTKTSGTVERELPMELFPIARGPVGPLLGRQPPPVHATLPSARNPQVLFHPAHTCVNVPDGPYAVFGPPPAS